MYKLFIIICYSFHNQFFLRVVGQMGGPQKWGAPVHLHTLHIPKATTDGQPLQGLHNTKSLRTPDIDDRGWQTL